MKRILVSLLVLTPHLLWAQTPVEDLETRLVESSGSERIELLSQLAEAHLAQDPSRAATFATEAVELLEAPPLAERDQPALVSALEQLGQARLALVEVDAALGHFRASLKLARAIEEPHGIATNLLAIGKIHLQAGRYQAAAVTLGRAKDAALAIDSRDHLLEVEGALSETYAAQGRYREAYQASQRVAELEGSVAEEQETAAIRELEARLETERQEHARQLDSRQRELDALRQSREAAAGELGGTWSVGVAVTSGILLLLWLGTLLSRHRLKEHLSRIIADRDLELKQGSDLLKQTEGSLARTEGELEQTTTRLRRASFELERAEAELQQISSQLEDAQTQLESARFDLGRASSELEQTQTRLERVTGERDEAVTVRDRNSVQLARASSELEQTARELQQTTGRLEQTRGELDRLKQSYAQDIAELGDRNAVTRQQLSEMEGFTSAVSQHLKVLLISIRSSLGALQQDAAAGDLDQLKEDVHRTHHAVGRVVRLLDKLLKLLLIGRIVGAPTEVPMSELAFEAAGQVPGLSDRRAEIVIAPDMPSVAGDRTQLLEVLRNLLENAGKFMGDQTAPKIEVGFRPAQDTADPIFFVRDNGIGIEPRDQKRIFTLFERLNPEKEGVGLGLGLVKRILTAHQGRIWVESEGRGHGSTFCFTLGAPEPDS